MSENPDIQSPNSNWLTLEVLQRGFEDAQAGIKQAQRAGKRIAGFMGSARVKPGNTLYEHAKNLAKALGKLNYAILTGGGSGIMAAANEGAHLAGAPSLGNRLGLLSKEHIDNTPFTDLIVTRELLFIRRFLLTTVPTALPLYPGGFGTQTEGNEILTLLQTSITAGVPVICLEDDSQPYWTNYRRFLKENMLPPGYIDEKDLDLFDIRNINEEESANKIAEEINERVLALGK
ncbi:MAG: LOG family protein [Patescibacteria group bacterium]